ncbi:MAG: hypothetical protein Q4C95_10950, partial [Planctomycetia bacterium]|nr:hypothetical protein [Planctomycetia bacterium]
LGDFIPEQEIISENESKAEDQSQNDSLSELGDFIPEQEIISENESKAEDQSQNDSLSELGDFIPEQEIISENESKAEDQGQNDSLSELGDFIPEQETISENESENEDQSQNDSLSELGDFIPEQEIISENESTAEDQGQNVIETKNSVSITDETLPETSLSDQNQELTIDQEYDAEVLETPGDEWNEPTIDLSQFSTNNEVWVISSERLGNIHSSSLDSLCYWQLSPENQWELRDINQFVAGDRPDISTIIYIHGNYLTQQNYSVQDATYLKNRFETIQKNIPNAKPFRLVIWKWTSERILARIRKDCQLKASLAEQNGFYLADLLAAWQPQGNVTLIGFSFGSRTIGSALELLAGGTVWGLPYHSVETEKEPGFISIKMILVSAASDYNDFQINGRYANGLTLLNGYLNVFNPTDRALKFYPKLYECQGPVAVGSFPVNLCSLPENLQNTTQSLNTSNRGPEHNFIHSMQCIPSEILQSFVF